MNKTLKKLTLLAVVSLVALGGILGGLSATATAQSADEDAIKAEVLANTGQFVEAFNTSDIDLLETLFINSDKTTWISALAPFRVDGWDDVRSGVFARLLSLPPGAVNLVIRQPRIDLLGENAALATGHFIINIRPPGAEPITLNGRFTAVFEKVDGKWLRVHGHTSALP